MRLTGERFYLDLVHGFRIVETPIIFVDRRVGKSKMNRKIVYEAVFMVWRVRFTR